MTKREYIRTVLAASPEVLTLAFRAKAPRTSRPPTPAHERRIVIDQLWDNLHDLAAVFGDTLDIIEQRRKGLLERAGMGFSMPPEEIRMLAESLGTLTK